MKNSIGIKSLIVKIFSLLLLVNMTTWANNIYDGTSKEAYINESTTLNSNSIALNETVEVSLDSFSNIGIFILIVLSSILGAFFMRDEFSKTLENSL